jgi:hypothetical protein
MYRDISGPTSSPIGLLSSPLLQPIRALRDGGISPLARARAPTSQPASQAARQPGSLHPRKCFPNSDKAPRCIIRCARPRAANKFFPSNANGILLSSFRRARLRDTAVNCLFFRWLSRNFRCERTYGPVAGRVSVLFAEDSSRIIERDFATNR